MDKDTTMTGAETVELSGAEMVIRALKDQGVEHIFGYPGGAVLPIYDALFAAEGIIHVLCRHEQGATHAAEGYARSTGKPGVVLVTSGPGATNAVTGLTDALMDSIPLVVLTGQVATHLIGNDAFQECDTIGITRPCTKHNWLVKDVNDLPRVLHEAFQIATTGRPGPVVVDIPKDVQFKKGTYIGPQSVRHRTYKPKTDPDLGSIVKAIELMEGAKRPIFYSGGGIINSGPRSEQAVARTGQDHGLSRHLHFDGPWRIPGFRSAMARHAGHARHLRSQSRDARLRRDDLPGRALRRSRDRPHRCVLAELEEDPSRYRRRADQQERARGCAHRRRCGQGAEGDAAFLENPARKVGCARARHLVEADRGMAGARNRSRTSSPTTLIKPQYAIDRLYELTRGREIYITTEVGQHQMWAAQRFKFEEPNHWMTSGGLGTMGYGLPASVGVQMAHPDALVIDIAGEASVQMTMQEMSTAVQYDLPIKIFILNNEYMGMVRQWQQLLHGGRYSHSYSEACPIS